MGLDHERFLVYAKFRVPARHLLPLPPQLQLHALRLLRA